MPSDDIVEQLREEGFVTHMARLPRESKILHEAADEIMMLRSAVLRLEAQHGLLLNRLAAIQNGFEGCCHACEPVGVLNKKLSNELELLRQHICRTRIADAIVDSEPFMWLMAGSNHLDSNLASLRPAYSKWKESGGMTQLKQSNEYLHGLERLDNFLKQEFPDDQKPQ